VFLKLVQMSILLVTFNSNSRSTGVGKWSHEIATALEGLGHTTTLWFEEDFPLFCGRRRLAILFFPLALAIRIVRERNQFEVVILHEPIGFWYGVFRRQWAALPPMVVVSHGIESLVFREMIAASRLGFAHILRRSRLTVKVARFWQSDGALRLADQVVCLTQQDKDYAYARLRIASTSITVMKNGVNIVDPHYAKTVISERSVVFVGGWLDVKGKRLLPEIWRQICNLFDDARLSILGPGCAKEMVEEAFDSALRGSLYVVPHIEDQDEMVSQYLNHSVFLMPSLREGSPLALLEAMASGLVPVASRVGGIPDIVTDGTDGLLFDSMDIGGAVECLRIAFTEPERMSRIRAAAVDRARQLTWRSSAMVLETAVQAAIQRSRV